MNRMESPAHLPMAWVDKIFRKLNARYGRYFLAQYDGVPIEDVKADWSEELAGLQNRPEAIAYAIDSLPERAIRVSEFRQLCLSAPRDAVALPPPAANPEFARAVMAKVGKPAAVNTYTDWIARGMADLAAGIKKTPAVEKAIRDAARIKGIREGVMA